MTIIMPNTENGLIECPDIFYILSMKEEILLELPTGEYFMSNTPAIGSRSRTRVCLKRDYNSIHCWDHTSITVRAIWDLGPLFNCTHTHISCSVCIRLQFTLPCIVMEAPNPGKHAPKSQISCELCQRRKVRCDKGNPCSTCQRVGVKCEVSSRQRLPRGRNGKSSPYMKRFLYLIYFEHFRGPKERRTGPQGSNCEAGEPGLKPGRKRKLDYCSATSLPSPSKSRVCTD